MCDVRQLATRLMISSRGRTELLTGCSSGHTAQRTPLSEVVVAWRETAMATRDCALRSAETTAFPVCVAHSHASGKVPGEDAALGAAEGNIAFLVDDDVDASS